MTNGTKKAFTLAEVLITLGIIGVVAAMTMPTLLNSTQGAQYRTAYKKALSVLSQAVVLNVALDDYDLSQATKSGADGQAEGAASLYNLFNNRMNVARVCGQNEGCVGSDKWTVSTDDTNTATLEFGTDTNYTYFFNDGIALSFAADEKECTEGNATVTRHPCKGVIDVNGSKNPNKLVKCDANTYHDADCKVTNPTDVYPVVMYDQSIVPNSQAAKAVLFGGK